MTSDRPRTAGCGAADYDTIATFLRDVRLDLAATYPTYSRRRIQRILDRHGLSRMPDALLLNDRVRGPGWAVRTLRRLAKRARRIDDAHPLFSPNFYRAAYPDIAASGVDPWLHYQVLGRLEGRTPHPLIDLAALRQVIVDRLPGEVLDTYLTCPQWWLAAPGPYVDAESFVVTGPWDGVTNPLVQIVRSYPVDPWIRVRLGTIDMASSPDPVRVAAGVLALRNPQLARSTSLSVWRRDGGPRDPSGSTYRVIPGYFLGSNSSEIAAGGRSVASSDGTALRNGGVVVMLDARKRVVGNRLMYLVGEESTDLAALASELRPGDIVAPASSSQERALRGTPADVLAHGHQVIVDAAELDVRILSAES